MINRKQQVMLTAQKLFIEKGYTATSIQDILEKANISKGTFYNYFSSKNECLMAILEYGREKTILKRDELLVGASITDKSVLAKQILIRLQVNNDYNLLPIFQAIFHSSDQDLKDFAKKYYLTELYWLKERLIEIYGEESIPYATDGAVLTHGMLQHMLHVSEIGGQTGINLTELVQFIMKQLDVIMTNMIHRNISFLKDDNKIFTPITMKEKGVLPKQQLINQINKIILLPNLSSEIKQYIYFIREEMMTEEPRFFVLESILCSLKSSSTGTPNEIELRKIITNLWSYINKD